MTEFENKILYELLIMKLNEVDQYSKDDERIEKYCKVLFRARADMSFIDDLIRDIKG